jgi:hypothetical protein
MPLLFFFSYRTPKANASDFCCCQHSQPHPPPDSVDIIIRWQINPLSHISGNIQEIKS